MSQAAGGPSLLTVLLLLVCSFSRAAVPALVEWTAACITCRTLPLLAVRLPHASPASFNSSLWRGSLATKALLLPAAVCLLSASGSHSRVPLRTVPSARASRAAAKKLLGCQCQCPGGGDICTTRDKSSQTETLKHPICFAHTPQIIRSTHPWTLPYRTLEHASETELKMDHLLFATLLLTQYSHLIRPIVINTPPSVSPACGRRRYRPSRLSPDLHPRWFCFLVPARWATDTHREANMSLSSSSCFTPGHG
jgi:hypothetical protein